jgi:hypothetical protein
MALAKLCFAYRRISRRAMQTPSTLHTVAIFMVAAAQHAMIIHSFFIVLTPLLTCTWPCPPLAWLAVSTRYADCWCGSRIPQAGLARNCQASLRNCTRRPGTLRRAFALRLICTIV